MVVFVRLLVGLLVVALFQAFAAEVFPTGSTWRFRKGTSEASSPSTAWRLVNFDDSTWDLSPGAFYYGEPLSGTQLGDMRNNYTSIFLRKEFTIASPSAVSELILETLCDDGFIAWINGNEVARYNMPGGNIPYNGTSSPALGEPIPWETYTISGLSEFLVPGKNVLAVQAFNSSIGSSTDFIFDASLSATVDVFPPTVEEVSPTASSLVRALTSIEVIFSEPVANVDAEDLLINGVPATGLDIFGPNDYVFTFSEPAPGQINITFATGHGITDLAPAPNAFAGFIWSYTLDPDAPLPTVMLNEFLADNDKTLNDEDGDSSDWIEIFNPTESMVNLTGWFLTSSPNNLAQWKFPDVSIGPNGYLVIFASEKNRNNPAGKLHTNFKIDKDGGYLALVGPRTNVVSEISNYPPQEEDISYGRPRGNPIQLNFFPSPSPGKANLPGGAGFAPEVTFSKSGRTFVNSLTLELSTPSPTAVIRYTLGTNLPSETSPIYSQPLTLSNSVQVRARAFQTGLLPGPPRSENYIRISGTPINFKSDLPIVLVHSHGGGNANATAKKFVMLEIFEPKAGVASMTNTPDLSVRATYKLRGSSTQGLSKPSWAVELIDEYGDDEKHEVLGMPEESDWVFYAPNSFEPVMIHNPFMHQLSRDIGRYSPRTRFVEVYQVPTAGALQQNNYYGIYVIEEKIKRGRDRVDVDKLEPEHITPPNVTGGYMLKVDRPDPDDFPFYVNGEGVNYVDPKRVETQSQQRSYIEGYFNEFATTVYSANYADPVNGYAKYIDVSSWIDHHVLNVLAYNVDALRLSTYFYKPRNGKITYGPLWDFDRALGSTDGRDSNPRTWASSGGTDFFYHAWWSRVFRDLEFWQLWIDRYHELRRSHFSTTNLYLLVDHFANQVRQAQPREQAKWGISPRGGSYQAEVNLMKTWLSNRVSFIDSQLVRAPFITTTPGKVSSGTTVTITQPPNTTVYFTLDGSDPRLRGGQINPQARAYSGPITIDKNTRLVARAYNPSHTHATGSYRAPLVSKWSGAHAETFYIDTPPLIISEIMYAPAGPPPGSTSTNELYEFIELKNRGTTELSLIGFAITNGVSYEFTSSSSVTSLAPGERVLVVKNRAAFISRYGSNLKIAGEYEGSLDNAGERLALVGPMSEPIHDFAYADDWYPMTESLGFSLVPVDESAPLDAWQNKSGWRMSANMHGSPGAADPTPPVIPRVLINEVLSRPAPPGVDAVELYNPGSAPVDLEGWYLSDNFSQPRKYRFPGGTRIEPDSFLQLTANQFNVGANGFSFSSEGEEVYLFSADLAGKFTGYHHGFEFGAARIGMAFGRHVTSDQREVFVAQTAPTLGQQNSGPALGPVIITEIMFYPPMQGIYDNTLDEFIEIQNISSQTVQLFDVNSPGNTWRLWGGADFDFPPGVSLAPGEIALLVKFEPDNTGLANAFRTKYSVNPTVPLYGPYVGQLSNNGELISIQQPDTPDTVVPYVVVDELNYGIAAPWPSDANGTGRSLQRLPGTFADDPASWVSDDPTPGQATEGTNPDRDGDGLPNDWEIAHGLNPDSAAGNDGSTGDADGDGMNNLAEFQAGTDPGDDESKLGFTEITRAGGPVSLSFHVVEGRKYSIYFRSSIDSGDWQKIADIPVQTTTGVYQFTDNTAGESTRFYRLHLEP